MTKRASPEADLQKMCLQWLRLQAPDVVAFSVPNEGTYKRKDLQTMGVMPGVADVHILWSEPDEDNLMVCVEGQAEPIPLTGPTPMYGAIEFKAPRKAYKTSKEQDKWLETVQRMGHKVAVCDDFERFQELMRKWGVCG